ncbi:Clp protease N-terminal domain-containing protein, partial [Escherichia coli]|nr:Clp protease N-terminal domain-containing protein [Escherichia coli]
LNTLIAKLNPTCRQAALLAANNCLARGHYEVDLEHLLLALLEEPASDVTLVLRASRVDAHALRADVERELQRLKTGNTRTPVFSKHLLEQIDQVLREHRRTHIAGLQALQFALDIRAQRMRIDPACAQHQRDVARRFFQQRQQQMLEVDLIVTARETVVGR